jgi:hypothetical protein
MKWLLAFSPFVKLDLKISSGTIEGSVSTIGFGLVLTLKD